MTSAGGNATHQFAALSVSGAGSAGVGVAGSFALNYVQDKTEAVVRTGAIVAAGTGNVSVIATNTRTDIATAKSKQQVTGGGSSSSGGSGGSSGGSGGSGSGSSGSGGSSSSSTGVGASVALNILTPNLTRAEIEDGATVTGGANFTVRATSTQAVDTNVQAGASGDTAVAPAVAVAVVLTDTTTRVGTGTGINATGSIE